MLTAAVEAIVIGIWILHSATRTMAIVRISTFRIGALEMGDT